MNATATTLLDALEDQVRQSSKALDRGLQACTRSIDDVHEAARTATGGVEGHILARALDEHQRQTMDRLQRMAEHTERQRGATEDALALIQEVAEVTTGMRQVTRASRRLALNATITSSRLGQKGRSLAMVAVQSKELANQIRKTADGIRATTDALEQLLPQLSDNGASLDAAFSEGRTAVEAANSTLGASASSISEFATRLEDNATATAADVRNQAETALAALSFGDRFQAGLRELEEVIEQTREALAAEDLTAVAA